MSTTYYAEVEVHGLPSDRYTNKEIEARVHAWFDGQSSTDVPPADNGGHAAFSGWTECFTTGGPQREHDDLVAKLAEVAPGLRVVSRWFCWDHVHWDAEIGADEDED